MTVLKGLQYRTHTSPAFSAQPYSGADMFDLVRGGGWIDVPEGKNEFPIHTEFRMKPLTVYRVHENLKYVTYRNKTSLMEAISKKIDAGDNIQVSLVEEATTKFTDPLLQVYRQDKWTNISIGDKPVKLTYASKFRLRPDFYYTVSTINNPLITSHIDFEEADKLAEYVSNRIRTNGLDFSVRKVKYV